AAVGHAFVVHQAGQVVPDRGGELGLRVEQVEHAAVGRDPRHVVVEGLAGDAAGDGLRAQAAGDAAAVLRIVGRLRGRGRGGGWLLCHRGQRQRAGQDGEGNGDKRGGAGHRGAPWGNGASSIAWRGVAACLRGRALGDVHGRGECTRGARGRRGRGRTRTCRPAPS